MAEDLSDLWNHFLRSCSQIVKYFLDPKTLQKVKFVYPKNEESMELMRMHFDLEALPLEFGGKSNIVYNHEEFSRLMAKDDIRMADAWGLADKNSCPSSEHSSSEVSPKPAPEEPNLPTR